jgi:hypothetical protein
MVCSSVRAQVDIRGWLEGLFPGLSWEQAVAVVGSGWLILMAALTIALSSVAGGQAAAAGPPVIVRVQAPRGMPAKSAAPPRAVASAGGGAPGFGAGDVASSRAGGGVTSAAPPAETGAPPTSALPAAAEPAVDTPPADPGTTPAATTWAKGSEAYTVAIAATKKEDEAQGKVDEALAVGIDDVGYVASAAFRSLEPGWFVVFGDSYPTLAAAKTASEDLARRGYSEAQPVWISETRARRCEDGEQPRPADPPAPATGDAPTPTDGATTTTGDTTTTTTTGGATTTTGDTTTTTTTGGATTGDTTTTGDGTTTTGTGTALPVLELRCEVRAADEPKAGGKDESGMGGGPTVNP